MAAGSKSELVPISDYAVSKVDPTSLATILRENVGRNLTEFDLTRVKVPTGGMTAWSIPSLDGTDDVTQALDGVIVYHREPRAFWRVAFDQSGGGTPPDCASSHGDVGVGDPGVECATCPFSQWGSKPARPGPGGTLIESRGQACKQMKLVFLLRPESLLPVALFLPPTSIVPARKYLLGLASEAQLFSSVTTRITLEKDRSSDGIEYAKARFARTGVLDAAEAARIDEYAKSLRASLDTITITADDLAESGV